MTPPSPSGMRGRRRWLCFLLTAGSDPASACYACRETKAEEVLPPTLGSGSQPPNLFDGTTRLYISYICPYVQRVWIARNFKVGA
jgi:glutathione S-transferase